MKKKSIEKEFITASSGNHGAAFAYALKILNLEGTIVLPENVAKEKLQALKDLDARIQIFGTDCVETEIYAKNLAKEENKIYISPYNDLQIIGGQGTISIELINQLNPKFIHIVFIPIGGGGLISGMAGYFKEKKTDIKIIGCQPKNSAIMYESIKQNQIVKIESKSTLSDGTAGGIEPGSITFNLCQKYVDEFVLVSEEEIKNAIELIFEKHHMIIEGAAALSLAAFLKNNQKYTNKNVILLISGGKLGKEKLREVFC